MSSIHGVWATTTTLEKRGETGGQRGTKDDDGRGGRDTRTDRCCNVPIGMYYQLLRITHNWTKKPLCGIKYMSSSSK